MRFLHSDVPYMNIVGIHRGEQRNIIYREFSNPVGPKQLTDRELHQDTRIIHTHSCYRLVSLTIFRKDSLYLAGWNIVRYRHD